MHRPHLTNSADDVTVIRGWRRATTGTAIQPRWRSMPADNRKELCMGYGIGGVLVLILLILAIIYLAKRV